MKIVQRQYFPPPAKIGQWHDQHAKRRQPDTPVLRHWIKPLVSPESRKRRPGRLNRHVTLGCVKALLVLGKQPIAPCPSAA
jgi:hypothetical protein